jgi:hypothetical protein
MTNEIWANFHGVYLVRMSMRCKELDQISEVLPDGATEVAREQLTRVASKGSQTLGLTFSNWT